MLSKVLYTHCLVFSLMLAQPNPGCKLDTLAAAHGGKASASMALDAAGRLLIADTGRSQIAAIGADGSTTVVAGTGQAGFAGDNGPALAAQFANPSGVARDSAGNIYVADTGNRRVRKIDTKGQVTTIAGSGANVSDLVWPCCGPMPPAPPLDVPINRPLLVTMDGRSNLYIFSAGTFGTYLLMLSATDGLLRLVYPGAPYGTTLDPSLTAFAIDSEDKVVVAWALGFNSGAEINGQLVRILGDGTRQPLSGVAGLIEPARAMTFDEGGNLYIAESTRIRRISPAMAINTMVGFVETGTRIPEGYYSGELNFTTGLLASGETLFESNGTLGIRSLLLANCPAPPQPAIALNGILDASGMVSVFEARSPGELVTIYGTGLGPAEGTQGTYHDGVLDKQAAATRVLFNRIPGPVLYASSRQVNAIIPFATAGPGACVSVEYNGVASDNHCLNFSTATPGILVIQNQDGTVNSKAAPALVGSVVTAWSSGFGTFLPPVPDGQVVSAAGALVLPVTVAVAGVTAQVLYTGPAPGLVAGVVQLNIQIPAAATNSVPLANLTVLVDKAKLDTTIWIK
jgi:uncharacterized protein (TIGR03437 family)